MTSHDGSWGVLGEPGRSVFFISRRAHLFTTRPQARRWYCRDASDARSARRIALSSESARQCRRACGPRLPLSALRERYASPSACENLHPAAFSQRQAIRPAFSFAKEKAEKGNTEVIATGNIPPGSKGHQQGHGPIRVRSIGLYELFRHL